MGNTDLNTACRPVSSRRSGATSFCRNCSYDRFWISMRFGISTIDGILPKSLRTRRPHWIVPAITPSAPRRRLAAECSTPPVGPGPHVGRGGRAPPFYALPRVRRLPHFDRRPDLLELLLHVRGLGLGHLLLDRLGRAVDEILGLLEAQARQLAHDLDHLDLLFAGR